MKGLGRAAVVCTVLLYLLPTVWCSVAETNTSAILNSVLDGYDNRIRPHDTGPPVRVKLGIYVESMEGIRESTMDFSVTMYFRMFWQDPRLSFTGAKYIIFKSGDIDKLWTPDILFLYEKQAKVHMVTQINRLVRVQPDGSITFSSRISATLACNMLLHRFPMDSQNCTIVMSSYAYSTDDMVLYLEDDSIQIEPGITISKFSLNGFDFANEVVSYLLGNYSIPRCHFSFTRQMESYFLTVYIPSVLLVSIAWLSFWIDAKAAPARVALGITTVLTMTTTTVGLQGTLPIVTYAKAIDIWLAVCLLFVFCALLEYGMANYLLVVEARRETKRLSNINIEKSSCKTMTPDHAPKARGCLTLRPLWTSRRLDIISRFVFPVMFIAFNTFYWVYFLVVTA